MGMRYASTGNQATTSTSDKHMLEVLGGTGVVCKIYDLMVGADGTPADNALVYSVHKLTAGGTATAVTPEPLDAIAALAAEASAAENHTVEPTTGGIPLIELPINQRASYRWVAAPGGEFISALAAGDGYGFSVRSAAYTGAAKASVHHEE